VSSAELNPSLTGLAPVHVLKDVLMSLELRPVLWGSIRIRTMNAQAADIK